MKKKKEGPVEDLIEVWNGNFFTPRGVRVWLRKNVDKKDKKDKKESRRERKRREGSSSSDEQQKQEKKRSYDLVVECVPAGGGVIMSTNLM